MTHFDAVVVGAGPAGSSAALHMAKNGMNVALLERGDFPGNKNMFGGVIYTEPTAEIVPGFWQDAPLERAVTRDNLWFLDKDSAVEIGFTGLRFASPPYNKCTALRPRFDRWLADQAVKAGAVLQTQAMVRDLHYEKKTVGRGPVRGIILDDGSVVEADQVILAEGVLSSLTKKSGLGQKAEGKHVSLWVRETISLPQEKIEDRFLLEKGEGAVLAMIGYPTGQAVGLAGIFTNKESISLTMGMSVEKISEYRLSIPDLLTRLKEHPYVRRLLQGGKPEGYAAHLIPQGGAAVMPKFYGDGVMVVGDAAIMVSGRRGTDLAMLSGKAAAETAVQAKVKQDFSAGMLKGYKRKLENSFYMKNINQASDNVKYYHGRGSDSDYLLNTLVNDLSYEYFRVGMDTDSEKIAKMTGIVHDKQSPANSFMDLLLGLGNWGVL
ncbi:MAG: FAD-dependent oxidoreductase [Bacillota bacterium]|nr:FAD-dependent oxidoreductase [Bacillota bacterium]MDW7684416.1 FAD-dependent oxidoreductase [Bacillota bacterium]